MVTAQAKQSLSPASSRKRSLTQLWQGRQIVLEQARAKWLAALSTQQSLRMLEELAKGAVLLKGCSRSPEARLAKLKVLIDTHQLFNKVTL